MPGAEYLEAIILGVVQGIAEFLPISSSGHFGRRGADREGLVRVFERVKTGPENCLPIQLPARRSLLVRRFVRAVVSPRTRQTATAAAR